MCSLVFRWLQIWYTKKIMKLRKQIPLIKKFQFNSFLENLPMMTCFTQSFLVLILARFCLECKRGNMNIIGCRLSSTH